MSRVGKKPVALPKGVQVKIEGQTVKVKGPKGELAREFPPTITFEMAGEEVLVSRPNDAPAVRALHGTTRALIQNMITGVSDGFFQADRRRRRGLTRRDEGSTAGHGAGFFAPGAGGPTARH